MNKDFNAELLSAFLQSKRGKMKQAAFAKKIGITRHMLVDLEDQKVDSFALNLESYIKICKFLDVSLDSFIPKKVSAFRKPKYRDSNEKICKVFEAIASTLSRMDNRADQLQKGMINALDSLSASEDFINQSETVKMAMSEFLKQTR